MAPPHTLQIRMGKEKKNNIILIPFGDGNISLYFKKA